MGFGKVEMRERGGFDLVEEIGHNIGRFDSNPFGAGFGRDSRVRGGGERRAMDDRTLMRRVRAGEEAATLLLVERFHETVFGVCLRMLGHRQDAEDATQEVFLRMIRSAGRYDADRPLRPWVLRIAVNRCRTLLAKRGKRPMALAVPEDCEESRPGLGDPDDVAGEVSRALERLRPEYRMVFSMFHERGLAYEEIAEAVERPVGTVKTWLHRARGELAEYLAKRGVRC